MPGGNFESDLDSQDQAEIFDEDNYNTNEQLNEMKTFEEMPDVLDVTSAEGDRDDEEALTLDAGDFDPDAIDMDSELEEDHELDYRAVADDDDDDSAVLGAEGSDEIAAGSDPSESLIDERLDSDLEDTFPASDALSITRRED